MNIYQENISNEDANILPLAMFEGDIVVIDTIDQKEAEEYLSKQKIIGFDTESRAVFTKGVKDKISLVQLSGAEKAFLIRVNKTPLSKGIVSVLQSSKVIKIGLAIKDDITRMRGVNKFTPRNFIDLQSIVKNYGINELGLKKITAIVLKQRISKAQRLSNWNAATLTTAQLRYAATDAWVCREIYNELIKNNIDDKLHEGISKEK